MLDFDLLPDGIGQETSGTNFLVIHIILKALEDYFSEDESEDAEFYKGSAEIFFAGYPENSNYRLYLEFLGWPVEELGLITPERWCEIIETEYTSVSEAKPKIGMSTRLIPRETELWKKIRKGRRRK